MSQSQKARKGLFGFMTQTRVINDSQVQGDLTGITVIFKNNNYRPVYSLPH